MPLNNRQIKTLRAEGHRLKLKPVVTVGQNGLSDNVHIEIDNALTYHELVKIRIPALEKQKKKLLQQMIGSKHQAEVIETIGNIVVLYRRNEKQNRFAHIIDL